MGGENPDIIIPPVMNNTGQITGKAKILPDCGLAWLPAKPRAKEIEKTALAFIYGDRKE